MRRFKKWMLGVFVGAVLGVLLASPALAYQSLPIESTHPFVKFRNGNSYIETIDTSGFTPAQLQDWKDGMAALSGDTTKYKVVSYFSGSNGNLSVQLFTSSAYKDPTVSGSNITFSGGYAKQIDIDHDGRGGIIVRFYARTGSSLFVSSSFSRTTYTMYKCPSALPPEMYFLDIPGNLIIRDDLSDPEPEPDPEPDPDPLPPEPPEEPFNPAGPPDKPTYAGSYEAPYDLTVMDSLLYYLRDATGSVGGVLIPVLFLLSAVWIVWAAVRHYLSRGSHDGGGSGLL